MPGQFLAITERPEDIEFGKELASQHRLSFHACSRADEAKAVIQAHPQTLVFWDVDHPKAAEAKLPVSAQSVGQALIQCISPERVVAVSDLPLKDLPHLVKLPAFNHHVIRNYAEQARPIYARIAVACLRPDPFGVETYVPDGTPVRRIQVQKASQRTAAVEAINNVFLQLGGHQRLASMLAQTCDELLMNAIFSAPVDAAGKRYRSGLKRSSDFEMTGKEVVTLSMASTPTYLAVAVADQFGSLKKESILPFIWKDYQSKSYVNLADAPSAGLGLYGIVQSGQSLLFISKPKVKTEVILLFPVTKNLKEFRDSFRLLSFIFR